MAPHPRKHGRPRWWVLGAAVAVVVAAAPTVAVLLQQEESYNPARGVSVSEVLSGAQRYVGEEVSVVGAADVVTDDAMTMGEEDLIVVAPDPQGFDLCGFVTGERVRVTGTLHVLDARGVVERLPERSLLPAQFQGFERQPVLFAEHVSRMNETIQ